MNYTLNVLKEIFSIMFGGFLSSYLIAKFVINRKVDKEINELKKQIKSLEEQKKHIIKNVLWIVDDFFQTLPPNKSQEYTEGWRYGVIQTRELLKKQLNSGLDNQDILENDWSEENNYENI